MSKRLRKKDFPDPVEDFDEDYDYRGNCYERFRNRYDDYDDRYEDYDERYDDYDDRYYDYEDTSEYDYDDDDIGIEYENYYPKKHRKKNQNSKDTAGAGTSKNKSSLPWFLIKLVVIAAIIAGILFFVLGVHINHGNRMYPFVMDGDLLITYKLDPYHIGDVVLYRNPLNGETGISRIVAVGETEVQISEIGELLINGYVPSESVFYATHELEGSDIKFPYHMTGSGYFLLDDYREIGQDSRMFGEISKKDLLGKVVYVFRRRGI